jgi:hypothetical protein
MWMSRRRSRRAIESAIDQIGTLPEDWSVSEFVAAAARWRGREIHTRALPATAPAGLCGLWVARQNDDVVLHRPSSDPIQIRHVIAHEIGHMMLGHGEIIDLADVGGSLEGLTVEAGDRICAARGGSSNYDDSVEFEAELFATLVMTQARRDEDPRRRSRLLRAF